LEGVGIALESLRGNKRRAALTILGVAIGVVVVMVMAGVDQRHQQERLEYLRVHRATHVSGVAILPCRRERLRRLGENSPWRRNPAINDAEAIA